MNKILKIPKKKSSTEQSPIIDKSQENEPINSEIFDFKSSSKPQSYEIFKSTAKLPF